MILIESSHFCDFFLSTFGARDRRVDVYPRFKPGVIHIRSLTWLFCSALAELQNIMRLKSGVNKVAYSTSLVRLSWYTFSGFKLISCSLYWFGMEDDNLVLSSALKELDNMDDRNVPAIYNFLAMTCSEGASGSSSLLWKRRMLITPGATGGKELPLHYSAPKELNINILLNQTTDSYLYDH